MRVNASSLVFLILCLLLPLTGCENNPLAPDTRGPNDVWNQNSAFVPSTLNVSAGTTVRWTNKDATPHTVDSGTEMNPTGLFTLTLTDLNDAATFNFSSTGTFLYYCGIHGETGRVVVQ